MKNFIIFILSCFMILPITKQAAAASLQYDKIPVYQFRVSDLSPQAETNLDYTDWWYSEWDDCRYVFLPASADRSKLVITYIADDTLYLNGVSVLSGQMTSILSSSDEFRITVGNIDCGTLKIMQSNLGCIYLATTSGGLDSLDADRNLVETGSALMLNADGITEYNGEIEKLTARGNSSWDYSKKKPYNLKLPSKADLYGMGKAKKWALVANYLDHSMLRNKMTLEMSRAGGMEYTMDSVFVDLYADGSYRGTYQLSERVQIQKNRINIRDLEEDTEKLNTSALETYPQIVVGAENAYQYMENSYKYYDIPNDPEDITGGYLLQFQQWNRYGYKSSSGFITSRGQAVAIDGPEYASKEQVLYIRSFVQDAEDAIYSDTGYNSKGRHYSEYIDVDSFIRAYLVQEISMNIDAAKSSFYIWKDSDLNGDGKLHFSPAWDFDLSYNNFAAVSSNSDGNSGCSWLPDNLFAAYFPISGYNESGRPTEGINWIGRLCKRDNFVRRTAVIYYADFEQYLSELTVGKNARLMQMARDILPSAEMSNARWHTYGGAAYCVFGSSSGNNFMESVDMVRSFAEKRKDWLSELWLPYMHLDDSLLQYGDVDCDEELTAGDAACVLQKTLVSTFELPIQKETDDWLRYADVGCDGEIAADDAAYILQKVLVSTYTLPVEAVRK